MKASSHDPEQFRLIWERRVDAVFRYAARRVGRVMAREVVAETFLRAFERRERYEPLRETCLPWLYKIAYHVIGERIRETNHGLRMFVETEPPFGNRFEDDVESRVIAESVRRDLEEALSVLSDYDRETLMLFALEDLTYSEIAAVLDIPPGTVASRINRARRVVRAHVTALEQRTSLLNIAVHDAEGDDGG